MSWEFCKIAALEGNVDACEAATPERAARHRWNEPSQLLQPLHLMGVMSVPFSLRPVEDPQ